MPRYVILEHDHPVQHWDLMLESGPTLRTWRLAAPPHSAGAVRALQSFDHRIAYLDYEGPVSGGRGNVKRWDSGTYCAEVNEPDLIVVCLASNRWQVRGELSRLAEEEWSLSLQSTAG